MGFVVENSRAFVSSCHSLGRVWMVCLQAIFLQYLYSGCVLEKVRPAFLSLSRWLLFPVVVLWYTVWPEPSFSVASTYVDFNLPASNQPSARYELFIQRPGEQSFAFFGSYDGKYPACSVVLAPGIALIRLNICMVRSTVWFFRCHVTSWIDYCLWYLLCSFSLSKCHSAESDSVAAWSDISVHYTISCEWCTITNQWSDHCHHQ